MSTNVIKCPSCGAAVPLPDLPASQKAVVYNCAYCGVSTTLANPNYDPFNASIPVPGTEDKIDAMEAGLSIILPLPSEAGLRLRKIAGVILGVLSLLTVIGAYGAYVDEGREETLTSLVMCFVFTFWSFRLVARSIKKQRLFQTGIYGHIVEPLQKANYNSQLMARYALSIVGYSLLIFSLDGFLKVYLGKGNLMVYIVTMVLSVILLYFKEKKKEKLESFKKPLTLNEFMQKKEAGLAAQKKAYL
ncbi:hypothetical protein LX64_03122 [Chitinophaga skermanii]|uniref:Uncharacterized protein n=1 Tax=Chitinophaga skermanii TaxID=331697 RepID=A0A327QKL7_9BACT|nr:hypothetical protein [Chitinophaga skermanii]RAJ04242.1 hypothetical protein LX64_03122 [Chitinophaga skermanii]